MRIITINTPKELKTIMQRLKVDTYGIKIMAPKSLGYLIKIDSLSSIAANILKQEMLSLGGDVALPRGVLTGKIRQTDCILIGNLSQYNRLREKLKLQPFGLSNLAKGLSVLIKNYQKDNFILNLGRYALNLGRKTHIMGILNLTPDSFSGDGIYQNSNIKIQISKIADVAKGMVNAGADIIDIGGESSRPQAKPISLKEELKRTIPAIKKISKEVSVPISVDTSKPEVAEQALDNGALIVNDITGLKNLRMRKIVAKYKAATVIMHMKGSPGNMQDKPFYHSVIEEIMSFLDKQSVLAINEGVDRNKILIDPGIGFGKTLEHNLEILKRLREFKALGRPILIGPSRKSFIGKILNKQPQETINGTIAACILAVRNGAQIIRVHDVREIKEALKTTEAILN